MSEAFSLVDLAVYVEAIQDAYPGGLPGDRAKRVQGESEPSVSTGRICFVLGHAREHSQVGIYSSQEEQGFFQRLCEQGLKIPIDECIFFHAGSHDFSEKLQSFKGSLGMRQKATPGAILIAFGAQAAQSARAVLNEAKEFVCLESKLPSELDANPGDKKVFWNSLQKALAQVR